MSYRVDHCSSCMARIIWTVTPAGRPMPVDADPNPVGNCDLQPPTDPREPPLCHVLGRGHRIPDGMQPRGFVRHMVHWATCPTAALHRKPEAKS